MSSEDRNQHITESLDHYLQDVNMKLAVMLTGDWGSGKTHFIKKYIGDRQEYKISYLSLFGSTSAKDISSKLLMQNHKVLGYGSKSLNTLVGFFNKKIGIDLSNQDGYELEATAKQILDLLKLEDRYSDIFIEDSIIVFDDIERCNIDEDQLLGYFNQLIEHKNCKLIIICNEEKIDKSGKYSNTLEKIIFQRLYVKTNFKSYMDQYLDNYKGSELYYSFLSKNREKIKKIFDITDGKNLRSIDKTIFSFSRIFDLLKTNNNFSENILFIDNVFETFLIISFNYHKNESLINFILKKPIYAGDNEDDYIEAMKEIDIATESIFSPFEEDGKKYKFEDLIEVESWDNIITKGVIEKEKITLSLMGSRYFNDTNTPSYVKIQEYLYLDTHEFNSLYNELKEEIRTFKYKSFHHITMIIHIIHELGQEGLIKEDISESIILAIEEIDKDKNLRNKVKRPYTPKKHRKFVTLSGYFLDINKLLESKIIHTHNLIKKNEIEEKIELIKLGRVSEFVATYEYKLHPAGENLHPNEIIRKINIEKLTNDIVSCLTKNPSTVSQLSSLMMEYNGEPIKEYTAWANKLNQSFKDYKTKNIIDKLTRYRINQLSITLSENIRNLN